MIVKKQIFFLTLWVIITLSSCGTDSGKNDDVNISGTLKKWHTVTLTFQGPELNEQAEDNPFLNYRLQVTFKNGEEQFEVPGFYAADGNAAESSADNGNKWRVRFTPNKTGTWEYDVSFRKGEEIAINEDSGAGNAVAFDGVSGSFEVGDSDKSGRDFRARGRLNYVGERYLQFAGSKEYFIKGGADSPENFLAYEDFDSTYRISPEQRSGEAATAEQIHNYVPHLKDWQEGDPSWKNGLGKAMIGAINYLANQGMNSVYFITMNIAGDGKDVWPYTSPQERFRFDVSKLAQWEIVFSHMERNGIMLHVLTQETENDTLLDGGRLGSERKIYYRELIARFGHHLAVNWNLGEENDIWDEIPDPDNEMLKAYSSYIKQVDPYDHFINVHTYPGQQEDVFTDLLGHPDYDGASLQMGEKANTHSETIQWLDSAAAHNKAWVVNLDEIGPASRGVDPDDRSDNNQDTVMYEALWGNLMAGGGGCEWYFGYNNPHNDLNCEDWRSRDNMWRLTKIALDFFHEHLPFTEMQHADHLVSGEGAYCFAREGSIYSVYLPDGVRSQLDLTDQEGTFVVKWFNPERGGALQDGSKGQVQGGAMVDLGTPPENPDEDWVVLVKTE